MSRAPRRPLPRIVWAAAALGLLVLFNVLFTEGFAHLEVRDGRLWGSLVDVLDRAAPLELVSVGMALVIGTGGVDLSVGAVMAIAAALAAGLMARPEYSVLSRIDLGGSLAAPLLVAMAAAAAAGAGNGLLVAAAGIQPIVATLVLMVAGRGVAQLLCGGQVIVVDDPPFAVLGGGSLLGLPVPVVIAAGAAAVAAIAARATALGLFVEAIGANPAAALHAGVPAGSVRVMAYCICGLLAGIAGIVAAADIRAADANNTGLYMELDAILAVAVGGTSLRGGRFSIAGALVGALLIQALTTTILSRGVPVEHTLIVKAAVVIAVCLLQSQRLREAAAAIRRPRP
jgi:simple sugar transport system permease protein